MKTILTIEHNDTFQDNLIECLEMKGYRVAGAPNGEIGIELAKALTPDLIICNVLMPVLNGFDVLKLIVNDPATSTIPFIFSTTQCEECAFVKAMLLGADGYFIKPYNIELLVSKIAYLINSGTKKFQERKMMKGGLIDNEQPYSK